MRDEFEESIEKGKKNRKKVMQEKPKDWKRVKCQAEFKRVNNVTKLKNIRNII